MPEFESGTSSLSATRSNQLSYTPQLGVCKAQVQVVCTHVANRMHACCRVFLILVAKSGTQWKRQSVRNFDPVSKGTMARNLDQKGGFLRCVVFFTPTIADLFKSTFSWTCRFVQNIQSDDGRVEFKNDTALPRKISHSCFHGFTPYDGSYSFVFD